MGAETKNKTNHYCCSPGKSTRYCKMSYIFFSFLLTQYSDLPFGQGLNHARCTEVQVSHWLPGKPRSNYQTNRRQDSPDPMGWEASGQENKRHNYKVNVEVPSPNYGTCYGHTHRRHLMHWVASWDTCENTRSPEGKPSSRERQAMAARSGEEKDSTRWAKEFKQLEDHGESLQDFSQI